MSYVFRSKRGFTLVEIIVVVGIIALLSAVVLASISQARSNTRDKKRLSDIKQYELAFTLYKEANGDFPSCDDGIELGVGSVGSGAWNCDGFDIDQELKLYVGGGSLGDPLAKSGGGGDYRYWYDASYKCDNTFVPVLFVRQMEHTSSANINDVCNCGGDFDGDPCGAQGTPGDDTYLIILD